MPDTLPRPEAAGPSFLVNHPPILEDKNVGISPSSPTGASSITATPIGVSIAQAKPQDFARPTRRASTFVEHSPVLSERESIFATNYTSVENDLPLLPPAGAATEPSSAPLVNSDMEFSSPPRLASTPNMLSIRPPSLTAARSGPNGIAGGLKQYAYTTSERPADKQLPASNGAIPGIRRVASDGHPWVRNSRTNDAHPTMFPGRDHPQEIPNGRAIEDDKAQLDTNAVERKDEAEQKLIQGAQRQSAMSQAMRPTRSERSASRGRTHVDKSIEATLANTEPGQNIRTRKSSHLMGVFRENATPLEPRPREASAPYTEEGYYTPTVSRPSRPSGQPSSRPTSIAAPEAISAQAASALQEDATPEWNQLYAPTPGQKRDSGLASNQVPATPKLPQSPPAQPKSPSKHDHDPYFRKQDAIKQSKGSQVPPVPVSLPEQTREHHNLVLMRGRSSTQDHSGFTGHEDTDFASRGRLRTGSIEGPPDENEEHISSAVYFPHPVPMEEIEQFNVPQRRPLIKGAAAEMGSSVPVATQTLNDVKWPSTDLAPPEHIDISVQSKHEKRVFHGDYQPPEDVQGEELDRDILPTIKERPVDSYAITSDSDIESGEDMGVTSQTDDGEITPTATPIVASQPRHGKRASLSSTGPKGAVLLEPYSHQVGGHSTIFRFSRRAVCKQLNNRENEFYERIERRHPEMLRFLPRYIGVLNVTFSKGPKPSKDASDEPRNILAQSKVAPKGSEGMAAGGKKLDEPAENMDPSHVADNEQRIVSHSQQIGERPQVILEQNRHIVPFSLFDFAQRPQAPEPQQSNDHQQFKPGPNEVKGNALQLIAPSTRPLLSSSPSWGKTSVNNKFGEQILRDVFLPPSIHHHKHARAIPRLREPSSRRRSNFLADPTSQDRHTASIPADDARIPAPVEGLNSSQEGSIDDQTPSMAANSTPQNIYSMSTSTLEDLSRDLEKVKSTNSIGFEGPQVSRSSNNKIKRRHSGMNLRRKGKSVYDTGRGDLEYHDDEGYGGDGEEEAFQRAPGGESSKGAFIRPSTANTQDLPNGTSPVTTQNEVQEIRMHDNADDVLNRTPTNGRMKQLVPDAKSSPSPLPLNPKEAQLAKPDQRVVFFLLLEDLTADMGRPCVLDLKMGTRQYGIEASPKKMESQRRKCKTTTSQQLGVRICGMQTFDVKKQQPAYEDKYFGRDLKAGREFREALTRFLYDGVSYLSVTKRIPTILDKLGKLESMVRKLPGYRFYASSLLMLYDAEPEKSQRANDEAVRGKNRGKKNDGERDKYKEKERKWPPPIELKIVDFANCVTGEDPLPPNAPCPPRHPGTVDRGYLRGLRTLKMYFQQILRDIRGSEYVERGDGDAIGSDITGTGGIHGGSEIMAEEDEGEVSI